MKTTSNDDPEHADTELPWSEILDLQRQARDDAHRSIDDLSTARAVLEGDGVVDAPDEEARRAIASTSRIEQRLAASATELDRIQEVLQGVATEPDGDR